MKYTPAILLQRKAVKAKSALVVVIVSCRSVDFRLDCCQERIAKGNIWKNVSHYSHCVQTAV